MDERANPHPRQILLVDDEDRLRGIIARYLRGRGHEVTEAATAGQARAVLAAQAVDMLLLDVDLGVETGWDVLSWLQGRGQMGRIAGDLCIVILSALTPSPDRIAEFAPDAVLGKPCSVQAVARIVETLRRRPDDDRRAGTVTCHAPVDSRS